MQGRILTCRLLAVAVLAAVLVLGMTAVALADDIYVSAFFGDDLLGDGSVLNPYRSIGAAMTTATAGDDIHVATGVYTEAVDLKTGVDIRGAGMATVFVTSDGMHAFEASGTADVTLDGLNFFGSTGATGSAVWSANSTLTVSACAFTSNVSTVTGAFAMADSEVVIEDCVFDLNEGKKGAALSSQDSSITVRGCTFAENSAYDDGGAIWSTVHTSTADATFVDCTFSDNDASGSGGAVDYDSDTHEIAWGALVRFDGCTFTGNQTVDDGDFDTMDGGAIDTDYIEVLITGCTFADQSAVQDGGAIYSDDCSITVDASTFSGNACDSDGGAISFSDSWGFVSASTFTSNTAEQDGGALDFYDDDLDFFVTDSTFSGNVAGDTGGGLAIDFDNEDDSQVTVSGCTITDNRVTNSAEWEWGVGGGIYVELEYDSDDCSLTVTGNTITDNVAARDGGGVFIRTFDPDDTGWDVDDFQVTLTGNTVTGNVADDDGGGLMFDLDYSYDTSITVADNVFADNAADDEGGGLMVDFDDSEDATVTVAENTVVRNTADDDGGGLKLDLDDAEYVTLWSHDNYVAENTSLENGGGLSIEWCCGYYSDLYFARDIFERNSATHFGGGVDYIVEDEADEIVTTFRECVVRDNTSGEGGGGLSVVNDDDYDYEEVELVGCQITGNSTLGDGGGLYAEYIDEFYIEGCLLEGNEAGYDGGGAMFDDMDDAYVHDNTIVGNTAVWNGGGIASKYGYTYATDNTIASNEASQGGGIWVRRERGEYDGNLIEDNRARTGGGIWHQDADAEIWNNVIDSNVATDVGGGIWLANSGGFYDDAEVVNNTLVYNTAGQGDGDGIFSDEGTPTIANNIIWDGWADPGDHLSGCVASYSITLEPGTGNFYSFPMFRDEAAGDYRLQPGSPAIDSGIETPTASAWAPDHDRDWESRPQDGVGDPWYEIGLGAFWDIGAYEMPEQRAPVSNDDTYTVDEDGVIWEPVPGVLDNDVDDNGDSLTAVLVTPPSSGLVALTPLGAFVYEPDPDWNGTDSFTYYASDGTSTSAVATVTITVVPVNDPPVSLEDTASCAEDGIATVDVLLNDSDPVEMDSLTATLAAQPASGTVVMDASGAATYTPDPDFNGTDMFWYRAFDGTDYGDVTTVTVTVTPVNDAPVANPDFYSGPEDQLVQDNNMWAINLNDTDVDGDVVWPDTSTITLPTNGTAWLDASGRMYFDPDPDWNGTAYFIYRATDGTAYSNFTTITVTITPVEDAPRSSEDAAACAEDAFAVVDVLANDTEVDGDPMTASLVGGPSNGSVELGASGDATYTPDADWFGTDYFWYEASDGTTVGAVTTVTVTVTPVNDAPVAVGDSYVTDEDTLLSAIAPNRLLDNDTDVENDPLWWNAEFTPPAHGTLIPVTPDGEFVYMPDPDWYGTDSFTYRMRESGTAPELVSNWTTVTITVNPVNDAPVSVEDTYTVEEDGMLIVPAPGVIQNDTDVEDDPLIAELTGDAVNGTLVFAETGALVYVPDADFYGTEYCYYRVFDGELWSMESTIAVTVTPVNDVPVSEDDTATCAEDGVAVFDVLANDTDADPLDVLTAQVWSDPDHGTVALDASGAATYTPDADWFGTDTFVYRTFDGTEYSALALVSITVTPVNDAPVAVPDHYETTESTTLTIAAPGVLANDYDIEDDSLTASITIPPASGTVTSTPDGAFEFLPDDGFWGADEFVYVTSDGATQSAPVTVTIDVFDVTPPTTTSDATWKYHGLACISFQATDTASGVAATYYSLDGGAAIEATSVCTDVLGEHSLSFWSVDVAGNIEDATPVEFEIEAASTAYETVEGPNRYATAVAASQRSFPSTVTCVVVATGENWPDALGGSALAGVKGAPILLSRSDALPSEVAAEITRLGATEAYMLGGEAALSSNVRDDLVALGLSVSRLGGSDRFGTARLIAREVVTLQGAAYDGTAFVCDGRNFPDALAAGPAAAGMGWPIYLSRPDVMDDTNLTHMVDYDVDRVIMLGGTVALGEPIETRLQQAFGPGAVTRIAGANRYQTGVMVAEWTVENTPLIWDGVAIATGEQFPDALAAGPMQAQMGSVLLLTPPTSLNANVETLLIGQRELIDELRFLGGTQALSASVRAQVAAALR